MRVRVRAAGHTGACVPREVLPCAGERSGSARAWGSRRGEAPVVQQGLAEHLGGAPVGLCPRRLGSLPGGHALLKVVVLSSALN